MYIHIENAFILNALNIKGLLAFFRLTEQEIAEVGKTVRLKMPDADCYVLKVAVRINY